MNRSQRRRSTWRHAARAVGTTALGLGLGLVATATTGCGDDDNQSIPNRVLDRPLDVSLACVAVETCEEGECVGVKGSPRTIAECAVRQTPSTCDDVDTPQLVGFVANSERNEIAMFTECSGELVDMDPVAPGYQFIPVGTLPSSMATTVDGCRVISSNAGSCDLSVLDAPALARYGLGPQDGPDAEASTFVANVRPLRFDPQLNWIPVGARVGQVLPVRSELSGSQALEGSAGQPGTCSPGDPGSVYVTFPTCDMVAEVDLVTQRIIQSFQFLDNGDGTYTALDTGTSPVCQVDCPLQVEDLGGSPDLSAAPVPAVRPSALEFVGRIDDDGSNNYAPSDDAILDDTLYVGGIGADVLFEIRMDEDGRWESNVNQLELQRAGGIERIQATPTMEFADGLERWQFLYLIAGDGSTRVVSRDFATSRSSPGFECETNPDPFSLDAVGFSPCIPVTPTPDGSDPADRAVGAVGPGIRPASGGRVTDWFFSRVPVRSSAGVTRSIDGLSFPGEVTGTGVTSQGFVLGVKFQQYEALPPTPPETLDPLQTITHRITPHMVDPLVAPRDRELGADDDAPSFVDDVTATNVSGLPTVANAAPTRSIPGDNGPVRQISPGFRRIDWAYSNDNPANSDPVVEGASSRASLLGGDNRPLENKDQLGGSDLIEDVDDDSEDINGLFIYDEPAVRIVPRDYRRFPPGTWELLWEGEIPFTSSATGVIACREPRWPVPSGDDPDPTEGLGPAYCESSEATDDIDSAAAVLRDETAAFCDRGVLPGDKLLIVGCSEDAECGAGRECLRANSAGGSSTGICVSSLLVDAENRGEDYLRDLCGEFIEDPCGEAVREYEIVRATQNSLSFKAIEIPEASFIHGPIDPNNYTPDNYTGEVFEEIGQFSCVDPELQPDGGCSSHADCLVGGAEQTDDVTARPWCVDGLCREWCDRSKEECLLRQVPGEACFRELVRYNVRLNNEFLVSGPSVSSRFFSDRVVENIDGECVETGTSDQVSGLLTSRIPLGRTDATLGLEECPPGNPSIVSPSDPNPCVITTPRGDGDTRFHQMNYTGRPVTAIRFTNPFFTIVIDLVDLDALTEPIPDEDAVWPGKFANFFRARIPRGYRMRFEAGVGYIPYEEGGVAISSGLSNTALIFPVRIVGRSPGVTTDQFQYAFVVDAAGTGTNTGLRGQVLKLAFAKPTIAVDQAFDAVR